MNSNNNNLFLRRDRLHKSTNIVYFKNASWTYSKYLNSTVFRCAFTVKICTQGNAVFISKVRILSKTKKSTIILLLNLRSPILI